MIIKQPTYRYVIAIVAGLIIVFIPDMEPSPFVLASIYLLSGFLLGFIWSGPSWRWGLWIFAPMFFLIGLSVVFSGQLEIFMKKDLPIMAAAVISACGGSFVGSWLQSRRAKVQAN